MKKYIVICLICILCVSVLGCAPASTSDGDNAQVSQTESSKSNSKPESESKEITPAELEKVLKEQPCYVEDTEYIVQDTEHKALYPDLLSAIIRNNSGTDIKNAAIVFAAWDKNNFPVKICGQFSYDEDYFAYTAYEDVNMVDGATYGQNYGLPLDDTKQAKIKTFKAIVVEYTDFDGNTWENPYFSVWYSLYYDKKLS